MPDRSPDRDPDPRTARYRAAAAILRGLAPLEDKARQAGFDALGHRLQLARFAAESLERQYAPRADEPAPTGALPAVVSPEDGA